MGVHLCSCFYEWYIHLRFCITVSLTRHYKHHFVHNLLYTHRHFRKKQLLNIFSDQKNCLLSISQLRKQKCMFFMLDKPTILVKSFVNIYELGLIYSQWNLISDKMVYSIWVSFMSSITRYCKSVYFCS